MAKISAKQYRQMAPKADGRFAEHNMQAAFFEYIDAHCQKYPHWRTIFACPNGARTSMTVAVRLKREGLRPGTPDIVMPFARGKYHGLFVEMKTPNNSPTQTQQDMIAMLIANGYAVVVCKSTDSAILTLNMYENGELLDSMLYQKYKRGKKRYGEP